MKDVAIDGTKILANASKHKAMSYCRMLEKSRDLKSEIYSLRQEVRVADGRKRKVLSEELQLKRARLLRIRAAKKELEARAKVAGEKKPAEKAQLNFTDPESPIMKVGKDFEQVECVAKFQPTEVKQSMARERQ